MALFDIFKDRDRQPEGTASAAKERLKVIVAHERRQRQQPDYLAAMQRDILQVVRKYIPIDYDDVNIQIEQEGQVSVLELNVTLPNEVIER
ncbi:cell division topological specificity factor MinE [Natronospirillum operosum]|uniref:Cell division topological specificity factor n=1 Tax=Natronospirillum operosum TaxID=2759953 RepID=A0A4Z0W691_9GAMM|nr:cell division topological specificity factor MinE [Natronospirillum operosum]TGG92745.1 cell division topological specificity factor MinE [Natronospirillum operosum]